MNTKNNKRRRESQNKIEKAFANMLLTKNMNKISVTDICKITGLNRTTFYANYVDIYDLADKVCKNIKNEFNRIFSNESNRNAVIFFNTIYKNQTMFKVYFKLITQKHPPIDIDSFSKEEKSNEKYEKYAKYHIEFFKSGLNAMIKLWLDGDCKELPEEMAIILKDEYQNRYFDFFI